MSIKLVGILNVTPDSFSDGGSFQDPEEAALQAKKMLLDGADIIDIGGESTRPGATRLSAEEELARVIPVIKILQKELQDNLYISVDTYKSEVAEEVLKLGVKMINFLAIEGEQEDLYRIVAKYDAEIVIYHTKGEPWGMPLVQLPGQAPSQYQDVVKEVVEFFEKETHAAIRLGVDPKKIIIDPGFGFRKSFEDNLEILKNLSKLKVLSFPVMIGVSRKSTLGRILQDRYKLPEPPPPTKRLEAALELTGEAIQNGATYIRTHDVKETKDFIATNFTNEN